MRQKNQSGWMTPTEQLKHTYAVLELLRSQDLASESASQDFTEATARLLNSKAKVPA